MTKSTNIANVKTKDVRVRNFPAAEHNILKSQAALEGKSLEEHIRTILLAAAGKKRSAA